MARPGSDFGAETMSGKRRTVSRTKKLLTLSGLLVFCFALALPLFAAQPESAMERASELGAWQAVMSPDGIELRDYLNRPISRDALQRELRAGGREVAHEAARLSEIPELSALLKFLDREDLNVAALREEGPVVSSGRGMAVNMPPRAPKIRARVVRVFCVVPPRPAEPVLTPLQLSTTPGRVRVQVLLL